MIEETNPPFPVKPAEVVAKTSTVEVSTSKGQEESHFRGITIKAYLSLLVVMTVCLIEILVLFACLYRHVEYVPNGQLMVLASSILSYYFARGTTSGSSSPSTTTTTSSSENKTP